MYLRILKIILGSFSLVAVLWLAGCVGNGGAGLPSVGQPTKVALLLPLQGNNAASGQAIRNGFLTAYYYAKQQQPNAPAVEVVDTSQNDILTLYQQAVANGANFVVGPLTKEDVRSLASLGKLPVPTLALNTLDNDSRIPNLYQFSLSPQDEAAQVAVRAKQDGHSRALVITPAGAWGQGIAAAFDKQWQALGGVVVDHYAYPPKADFSQGIANLLQVAAPPKNSKPGQRYAPRPRADADVIFLAAFPQQARQINPVLTFYNANMPVYAASLIYSGVPSQAYDQDLNGIEFGDMPWLLGPDMPQWAQMREYIKSMWPSAYNASPRLYAFGIDAYHLTYRLDHLSGLPGATGKLSMGPNGQIKRQLEWAKIQNGLPQSQ